MTQLTEHEALVEAGIKAACVLGYTTPCEYPICACTGTPQIARAVIAVIAKRMKEPTERMEKARRAAPNSIEEWRAMFDASPIVPGDGK